MELKCHIVQQPGVAVADGDPVLSRAVRSLLIRLGLCHCYYAEYANNEEYA